MTRVIHKQRFEVFKAETDVLTLMLPAGSKVLRIARQWPNEQTPSIWYTCDPSQTVEPVKILVVGTGGEFPEIVEPGYLGTEIFHNGQLVLHFFLLPRESHPPAPNVSGYLHRLKGSADWNIGLPDQMSAAWEYQKLFPDKIEIVPLYTEAPASPAPHLRGKLPKLPPIGEELYEHYPSMSAQTHSDLVKDYAREAVRAALASEGQAAHSKCAICGDRHDNDVLTDICTSCEARINEEGSP